MEALNRMLTSSIRLNQFLADHAEKLPADHLSANDTTCPICEEAYLEEDANHTVSKIKDCSHAFHRGCLTEMLDTEDEAKSCPMCDNNILDKLDRKEQATKALEEAWDNAHREAHLEEGGGDMSDASVGGSDTDNEEILYESSDEDELIDRGFGGSVESTDSSELNVDEKILENVDESGSIEQ
jgi:hypothetical protein